MRLLLLFVTVQAQLVEYKSIYKWAMGVKCDFDVVDDWDGTLYDRPTLIRNHDLNKELRKELNLTVLYEKYGDRDVGVDYPGSIAPPTPKWQTMKLGKYIKRYVNHSKPVAEMLTGKHKGIYLWGPTDTCDRFYKFGKKCEQSLDSSMMPKELVKKFRCVDRENGAKLFGLNGAYTGVNFHHHDPVVNEVIFGERIWFFYKAGTRINDQGKTAIEMIQDMVMDYWDDPTFVKPLLCRVGPGDTVFIPDNWVHMTFNLKPTLVGACNLGLKYKFSL